MNMTSFELGLLIVITSMCIFSIVNRICHCIEHTATAKSVAKTFGTKMDVIKEQNEKGA